MDPHQTKIFTAILITSIVLGTVLIYFIISLVRHQRKNLELHKKNILAEIAGLEHDRTRIATDLHDELGPLLAAINLTISSFELHHPYDIEEKTKTIDRINQLIKRLREISYDLMPNKLTRNGLVSAVEEFIVMAKKDRSVTFNFSYPDNFVCNQNLSINIFRIIQESVHNSMKHADATAITISFEKHPRKLILGISDNGVGFDHFMALKEGTGFGLRSLLSRTQIMGGDMYIDSKPGKGTRYTFEIPTS